MELPAGKHQANQLCLPTELQHNYPTKAHYKTYRLTFISCSPRKMHAGFLCLYMEGFFILIFAPLAQWFFSWKKQMAFRCLFKQAWLSLQTELLRRFKKISFFPWNTYLQEKWDKSVVVENQVCVFAMETAFIRNTVMGGISISTIASVQLLQHAGAASCRLLLTQPGRSISFINLVIMGCFWLQRLRWPMYSLLYSGNTRD